MAARRSVDWQVLFPEKKLGAGPSERETSPRLAALMSAIDELSKVEQADDVLKQSVEIAREMIGLGRPGLLVYDEKAGAMLGTWGTSREGKTQDEHHVMYEFGGWDQLAYDRARSGTSRWTLFEKCPIVAHEESESVVVGVGDVACTPIFSPTALIGFLFNTAIDLDSDLDEELQSLGAFLCSRLGQLLDVSTSGGAARVPLAGENPALARAIQLLGQDPTLSGKHLAKALGMSPSSLARLFAREAGMTLVEYRNHIRLDRFFALVDPRGGNLLAAALDAGFGSYTQFHRVFREKHGRAPKEFLENRAAEPVRKK